MNTNAYSTDSADLAYASEQNAYHSSDFASAHGRSASWSSGYSSQHYDSWSDPTLTTIYEEGTALIADVAEALRTSTRAASRRHTSAVRRAFSFGARLIAPRQCKARDAARKID